MLLSAASPASTESVFIPSGLFDMNVMVATDEASQRITGYVNLRECRFYFAAKTTDVRTEAYGRTFTFQAWQINRPFETFKLAAYSGAKDSFQQQITLHIEGNTFPRGCPKKVSIDRTYNVSYIGVRVVKVPDLMLFDFVKNGSATRFTRLHDVAPPAVGTGVWEDKIYGTPYRVPRFTRIAWYESSGEPRAAYVRERDLYPNEPSPN